MACLDGPVAPQRIGVADECPAPPPRVFCSPPEASFQPQVPPSVVTSWSSCLPSLRLRRTVDLNSSVSDSPRVISSPAFPVHPGPCGPSVTSRLASRTRTLVAVDVGCNGEAATYWPAARTRFAGSVDSS
jgi:hypothetical protein